MNGCQRAGLTAGRISSILRRTGVPAGIGERWSGAMRLAPCRQAQRIDLPGDNRPAKVLLSPLMASTTLRCAPAADGRGFFVVLLMPGAATGSPGRSAPAWPHLGGHGMPYSPRVEPSDAPRRAQLPPAPP